ncbi:MAG: hypothetical protein Q8R92_05685 [Deltaproteobacteria bacterium]|nr:hypothetical protein [Deltaproteobacteria bacterium]
MTDWIYYPRSRRPPKLALEVVAVFSSASSLIDSASHDLPSNEVLAAVAPGLAKIGFRVETGKTEEKKICVPVLFGPSGRTDKAFDADAWHEEAGFVVEVEAGRGVVNNQFLKDLFQACMMVGVGDLAIAVRKTYRKSNDFDRVCKFFETLYASPRLRLPLEGILLIGY